MFRRFRCAPLAAVAVAALCAGTTVAQNMEILGAGATFPYPLYSKLFSVYNELYGVRVNYQSIGSGGGIKQLENKTVDFGASDAFLSEKELEAIPQEIIHIPTCLGAVVLTYNLPGAPQLKLNSQVLSDIYLGKIVSWDDKAIAGINPDIKLPKQKIVVVYRSDGSGTTFVFTDYLAKISQDWNTKVGMGKSVKWPVGLGAKGNEGVSGLVKQMKGSIGYCELAYAIHNNMPAATLQNSKGNFIVPSIESISLAAETDIPAHTRVSITNTDADQGYPLASFTWILLYKDQNYGGRSKEKAKAIADLLWWMTHDGQKYAAPLDYSPLSPKAVAIVETLLKGVTFGGAKLLQ